jgi:hypothetical protein
MQDTSIMVDTSGAFRPLIPAAFCCPIFDAILGLTHLGIWASRQPIASRFCGPASHHRWQPGVLTSAVSAGQGDCIASDVLQAIANPTQQLSHLHINLVGPLPQSSSRHTHLLIIVDRSTRRVEAVLYGRCR